MTYTGDAAADGSPNGSE
jgi:hypothetical protein